MWEKLMKCCGTKVNVTWEWFLKTTPQFNWSCFIFRWDLSLIAMGVAPYFWLFSSSLLAYCVAWPWRSGSAQTVDTLVGRVDYAAMASPESPDSIYIGKLSYNSLLRLEEDQSTVLIFQHILQFRPEVLVCDVTIFALFLEYNISYLN